MESRSGKRGGGVEGVRFIRRSQGERPSRRVRAGQVRHGESPVATAYRHATPSATIRRSISPARVRALPTPPYHCMPMKHVRRTLPRLLRLLALTALVGAGQAYADNYAEITQLLKTGKAAEALTKADQRLAESPRDPQLRFLRGVAQADSGKHNDAIVTFTKLTEEYPELPEPYNNLAVLYARPEPARQVACRAGDGDPHQPQLRHGTRKPGRHLCQAGQPGLQQGAAARRQQRQFGAPQAGPDPQPVHGRHPQAWQPALWRCTRPGSNARPHRPAVVAAPPWPAAPAASAGSCPSARPGQRGPPQCQKQAGTCGGADARTRTKYQSGRLWIPPSRM
jgi:hypothetical protein